MRTALLVLAIAVSAGPLAAQSSADRARARRAAGDLAGAAAILAAHLAENPADAGAHALLAETYYWLGDADAAVASYRTALELRPDVAATRLAFGRTLVELRRDDEARAVLAPLAGSGDAAGVEARYLLATADYWSGEFTRARDGFLAVLALDPGHSGASAALREIRGASTPWLRLEGDGARDTQTLSRVGLGAEAGFYLTPLVVLELRGAGTRFEWSDSTTVVARGEIGLRTRFAGARTTLDIAAGAAHWSLAGDTRVTGRASIERDLATGTSLVASAALAPYTSTTASLAQPQRPWRFEGRLVLDHASGWAGEAAARLDRFEDGNGSNALWAWFLAPVLRGAAVDVRLGGKVAREDAGESRFVPVAGGIAPDGTPQFSGRYVPYYTPDDIIQFGVVAAAAVRPSNAVSLSADGSWSPYAREDAPFFFAADTVPGATPVMSTYRRSFRPLQARASLRIERSRTTLVLEAAHERTAFFDDTRARVMLVIRFPRVAT